MERLNGHPVTRNGRLRVSTWAGSVEHLECRRMLAGDSVIGLTPAEVDTKIDSFKSYFDRTLAAAHASLGQWSVDSGKNGFNIYELQYAVDGIVSMYEATGDLDVLGHAIEYTTNVMNSARMLEGGVYEHDGYLDWEYTPGGNPLARPQGAMLYDLQFGSAISRLARVIHEDARLQDEATIQEFGTELIEFIDEQIVFKWLDARNQRDWLEGFYDNNNFWNDKASHMTSLCQNVTAVLGDASSCGGIEYTLANEFKELLVVQNDGAYLWGIWDSHPFGHSHLAPDTSHENRVATMVTQLGADGFVFDSHDIELLANTFTERIWNGRTDWEATPHIEESPWFHNYIDGSDEPYRSYMHRDGAEGMNGFVYDGWIRLGEFDPEVQVAGEALLAFMQDITWSVNAIRTRNGTSLGILSLTGHLARNLRHADYVAERSTENALATFDPDSSDRLAGDADLDRSVTFSDFLVLSTNFGNTNGQKWGDGDFDGDSAVTMSDFLILAGNFGTMLQS